MHPLEGQWENLKREFEAGCAEAKRTSRAELAHELNQLLRRFRQYQSEGEWVRTLLDAAAHFAEQAAVFVVRGAAAESRGQVNLPLAEGLSFPVATAAAFAAAVESKDPVIALRSAGEVGEALSNGSERVHLFPVLNGSRVVAVLFAGGETIDANALELIAGLASMVLERPSNASSHAQISAMPAKAKQDNSARGQRAAGLPAWATLDEAQRELHRKAQRYARVTVAQMELNRPEACRGGREQGNFYVFLRSEIDKARETYQKQFMTIPTMVDYLHLQLVETAAAGDEGKLGADYPGALV
jgi:hypothetical protein